MNGEVGWGVYMRDVVASLIALAMVGAGIYMSIIGQEPPREFWGFVGLIIGYYFGVAGKPRGKPPKA